MLLTMAEALNAPEDAPTNDNAGGRTDTGAAVAPFSPTSEPAITTSPKEGQPKPDSSAHLSAASGITTRTVGKEISEPYWVLVVVLIAVVLIVTLAASFPYVSKSSRQLCRARSCRQLSAVLRESLDLSVRACDNFYRHVCNNWVANSRKGLSVFDEIAFHLRESIGHDVLDAATNRSKATATPAAHAAKAAASDKAALFYRSCVLAPANAASELERLKDVRREMGVSWPYLYPLRRHVNDVAAADGTRLVLEALVNTSVRWGFPLWFDVAVNLSKPRTVVIETLAGFPHPPHIEVWTKIRVYRWQFERLVLAMYKLFTKSDVVYDSIEPFLTSHWHVQSFVNGANTARDTVRFDNLATFAANLTANITAQTWADVLSAALDVHLTVDDTPVIVIGAPFLPTFNRMLLELNADSLLLYLGWAFQLSMGRVLSREVAAAINRRGLPNEDMADYCFLLTEHLLGFALTAPALGSYMSTDRRQSAEAVYNSSTIHFRKALEASPWMDNATKLRAVDRLTALQLDWTVHEHLPWEKLYASVPPVTHESFVANWRLLVQARRAFRSSMLAINARYHSIDEDGRLDETTHRLTIPVARLQPPLFYGIQEPSVAVALLGSWFTGKAMELDAPDNLITGGTMAMLSSTHWGTLADYFELFAKVARHVFHGNWLISDKTKERHDSAKHCFEPDFPGYSLTREDKDSLSLLEPTRHAFLASNTSVPGVTSAELRLPGLEMLQGEQIFFTVLCFTLCGSLVAEADSSGRAASGENLCNVPLMHSTHFAAAFKCPPGSPMNPEFKCTFW